MSLLECGIALARQVAHINVVHSLGAEPTIIVDDAIEIIESAVDVSNDIVDVSSGDDNDCQDI